jgi:hypothetical protein
VNDYLTGLERALTDAAVREYGTPARRPASRRPLRRLPGLALVAIVLVLGATAAAAIVVFGVRGSAPLRGAVPSLRILHYDVALIPDIEAGDAGWCSFPSFSIAGRPRPESGGGSCSPAGPPGAAILLAGGEPLSNNIRLLGSAHRTLSQAEGEVSLFYAVVTRPVAAIRLRRGLIVRAQPGPQLPDGWKGVIAFVTGQLDPVALDQAGRVLRETGAPAQLARSGTVPYTSASARRAPCSIDPPRTSFVTATWQVLATRVPALGRSVGAEVLFSCARSWYSVRGSSTALSAAILLGARNPRARAPALPGLAPTSTAGVYTEDGGSSGPILARRVGRAWLIVQGFSVQHDRELLEQLHPRGRALGRWSATSPR